MYLSGKRKMFCPKLKKKDVELAERHFGQLIITLTLKAKINVFKNI